MPMSTKLVIKSHRKKTWTNQLDYIKKNVIPALKKVDYSVLFFNKVSSKDFPTYGDIIKKPMDFSIVETRLKENYYESAQDCIDDMETVFANCFVFSQAAEDITLIGEHLMRERYLKKMEDFPEEEIPLERKKRGPGRKRTALSPAGASLDSEGHVSTRRHSVESFDSHSNPAFIGDGMEVSPSGNGESKVGSGRNALISRITKDQGTVPTLKVSSVPVRREREARPQANMGLSSVAAAPTVTETKPPLKLSASLTKCLKIINDIIQYRRRRFNWPFLEPVDPVALNLPDYFIVVKNPMDLSTIKKNLENGVYTHRNEVKEHIDLMLANCYVYNGDDSAVAECGRNLSAFFEKKFAVITDDVEPHNEDVNKRHKHKKVKKGRKRDRLDKEFTRFASLSPELSLSFLPEERERVFGILNQMAVLLDRMFTTAARVDQNSKLLYAFRDRINDDPVLAPSNCEAVLKQIMNETNSLLNLPGFSNVCNSLSGMTNGALAGSSGSGTGRSAGRPRKRTLPMDTGDIDAASIKVSAPGGGGADTGSGVVSTGSGPTVEAIVGPGSVSSTNAAGKGKRKRLNNNQPALSLEETTLGFHGGQSGTARLAIEEALGSKVNCKTASPAAALPLNANLMQPSHSEAAVTDQKMQMATSVPASFNAVGEGNAVVEKPDKSQFSSVPVTNMEMLDEHELSYEEKAELSHELQGVSDGAFLHELGAIVQRYEPQVQSASSGELDVDLSMLSNATLMALKRAIERMKADTTVASDSAVADVQMTPADMTTGANSTTKGNADVHGVKLGADEEMDEDEEDDDGDVPMPVIHKDERDSDQSAPSHMAASQRDDRLDGARGMIIRGTAGDLATNFSETDQSDTKPRGRRNRKAVNPVRHRGAATVLGGPGPATATVTGPTAKDDMISEQEIPSSQVSSASASASASASTTVTTLTAATTTMTTTTTATTAQTMSGIEPVAKFMGNDADAGDTTTDTESPTKPTVTSRDSNKSASSSTADDSSASLVPPPPVSKKGGHQVPTSTHSGMKMPNFVRKNAPKLDTPSKNAPKMETSASDISNKSDSDIDEDNEKESPSKSDDDFKGRSLGQPCPRRPVYEIFKDDETSIKTEAMKRRIVTDPEDVMQIQAQFHSIIYQSKSEIIARELERENEVRERREEEEKRKREDEERKRQEEQAKEARKEALKEQERKRLNEIRARNRRADMPLRQYADMANFDKKLDFSLLSPRWV